MRLLQTATGEVTALAFSASGDALVAAVENEGVFLWNLPTGEPPVEIDSKTPRALFFSPDGNSVAWLTAHVRKVYDRERERLKMAHLDVRGQTIGMTQTPDGTRLVTQHTLLEPALIGWSGSGVDWSQDWLISADNLSIHTVAICPTGECVALLTRKTTHPGRFWDHPIELELRSAVNGLVQATSRYPYQYRGPLLFSPDGTQLVSSNDMTLLVWPVPALGEPRKIRNDSRKHFTGMAYHPSGRYLFATSNDTTVHVFDTTTWERAGRFTWNLGRLRSVAVSPDGMLAAAGGDRGEVVVWDVDV